MELSQYTDAQLQKYHFRSGSGDLDTFLRKVSSPDDRTLTAVQAFPHRDARLTGQSFKPYAN